MEGQQETEKNWHESCGPDSVFLVLCVYWWGWNADAFAVAACGVMGRYCEKCSHTRMTHYSFFCRRVVKPIKECGYQGDGIVALETLKKEARSPFPFLSPPSPYLNAFLLLLLLLAVLCCCCCLLWPLLLLLLLLLLSLAAAVVAAVAFAAGLGHMSPAADQSRESC